MPKKSKSLNLAYLEIDSNYPKAADKRQRGYDFETYLFDLFESQSLTVKRPYRPKRLSEQIDGGVYLDGRWYLVECKWHASELPASEVYSFKGKVGGKLTGTIGFFISWSGYSEGCADALAFGKELNVLLFDSHTVRDGEARGWADVIRERLMAASLTGEIYKPEKVVVTPKPGKPKGGKRGKSSSLMTKRMEFMVEGELDKTVISSFLTSHHPDVTANIFVCHGKLQTIRLAQASMKQPGVARVLLVDGDGNPAVEQEVASQEVDLILVAEPEIEAVFFPGLHRPKARFVSQAEAEKLPPAVLAQNMLPAVIKADETGLFTKLSNFIGKLKPTAETPVHQ